MEEVRTFTKGLEVLTALNRTGKATPASIREQTGLSRGAVHRLLETLVANGYAGKGNGCYFLQRKALTLAAAIPDSGWLGSSQQIIENFCREVKWTISIVRPNGLGMVRSASTDNLSMMRFHKVPLGVRVPMVCSASGRAYLAFQPEKFQAFFVEILSREAEFPEDQALCQDRNAIVDILTRVKQTGAANLKRCHGISILAVPILRNDSKLLGSLCLRYFSASLSQSEAATRYINKMQKVADEVGSLQAV